MKANINHKWLIISCISVFLFILRKWLKYLQCKISWAESYWNSRLTALANKRCCFKMLSIYFVSEMRAFQSNKSSYLIVIGGKLYMRRGCLGNCRILIITPFTKILHNGNFYNKNYIILKIISLGWIWAQKNTPVLRNRWNDKAVLEKKKYGKILITIILIYCTLPRTENLRERRDVAQVVAETETVKQKSAQTRTKMTILQW